MTEQEKERLRQIGERGGTVSTNGMSSTQRQQVDAAVNEGRCGKKK